MGLAALSLETNPVFPTYPARMSPSDVSAGLVLPYAAVALLGKGGAVATLLIVFMAVTSASMYSLESKFLQSNDLFVVGILFAIRLQLRV
jgi:urea-proton symporter